MNLAEMYDYLRQSRRDLWKTLEGLPDEILSQPLAGEAWFPCLKDLIFHIITVEDGWLNMDILRQKSVLESFPALHNAKEAEVCSFKLEALLAYWQAVEQKTLEYLAKLTDDELKRIMSPHDEPNVNFTVDGLLWHVMLHEIRHTAQIAVLLRSQSIKPPSMDLLFYL